MNLKKKKVFVFFDECEASSYVRTITMINMMNKTEWVVISIPEIALNI